MQAGLALAVALALTLLVAAADRARLAPRLHGFWVDPAAGLHRLERPPADPSRGAGRPRPGLVRRDPSPRHPAGNHATPCRLRGFRRLVCGGEAGRVGLDGRRIFWDDGAVWLRQGLPGKRD